MGVARAASAFDERRDDLRRIFLLDVRGCKRDRRVGIVAGVAGGRLCWLRPPRAELWLRTGRFAVELREDPIETVEAVLQLLLDIVLRVPDDADRPVVTRVANGA